MRTALAVVGALALGVVVGALLPRGEAPSEPSRAVTVEVPVPVPGATRIERVPGDCAAEVDALRVENTVLRGQLTALGGMPIAWPEGVEAPFREAVVAAWLEEAEAELAAERLTLDCAEFPCVAVYRFAPGQPASSAVVDAVRQGFAERSGDLGRSQVMVTGGPSGSFAALSFGPADDEALAPRLKVRMEELIEAERAP